ncbi:MAG: tetratricopeptide repeat protein [Amphritea sp.]|nr:tetratricopeptide repeat protein [Amphritea sp.]MBQ0784607.1 tetratricopeptide repeat protein [Amphritea sp.]
MTDSPKAHSMKFWLSMGAFQVVFGLAVFGLTREYYISDTPMASAPAKPGLNWPTAGQTLSSDLLTGQGVPSQKMGQGIANTVGATSDLNVLQDPVEISRRANEMFAQQDYASAAKLYAKLLEFDPENASTYNNLGLTLHYIGRSDEALKMLEEGSIIDPFDQRLLLTLGFVSTQLGDTEKARSALKSAVALGADTQVGQSATKMLDELP